MRTRQLGVDDGAGRGVPQPVREKPGVLHRHHGVLVAVDDEERRRCPNPGWYPGSPGVEAASAASWPPEEVPDRISVRGSVPYSSLCCRTQAMSRFFLPRASIPPWKCTNTGAPD
ncbi:MAG TPA: hypothetical protein VGG16_25455 [Streptosporangiaceae bacterium]